MRLETSTISFFSGDKVSIEVVPSNMGCTYKSDNPLIASVSEAGEIKGITLGETYITVSNSAENFSEKCKVTVNAKYTMYKEPFLGFGSPVSAIKSFETRKLLNETKDGLVYQGENSTISSVIYLTEQNALKSSACFIPTSQVSLLANFLAERYVFLSVEDSNDSDLLAVFISNDKKIGVAISYYSISTQMVMYIDVSKSMKSGLTYNDIASEAIKYKKAFASMAE